MAENTGPFCYQIENLCSTTSLMWGSLRCTTRRSLYMGLYPTRRNQGSNSDLKALFPDEDGCKTRKHIQQTSTTSKVIPSKKRTTASFNLHHMHGSDTFKTHWPLFLKGLLRCLEPAYARKRHLHVYARNRVLKSNTKLYLTPLSPGV